MAISVSGYKLQRIMHSNDLATNDRRRELEALTEETSGLKAKFEQVRDDVRTLYQDKAPQPATRQRERRGERSRGVRVSVPCPLPTGVSAAARAGYLLPRTPGLRFHDLARPLTCRCDHSYLHICFSLLRFNQSRTNHHYTSQSTTHALLQSTED